jgi:two-component system cell cycle sensor histidine kinase/response regulator CckA
MRRAVVLVLLAVVLSVVCWRTTTWFHGQRVNDVRSQVTVSAIAHAISLSESIDRRFALLKGLAAYASTNARPHEAEPGFDTFVPLLAGSATGIRNMGVMPDGITKYIYPLQGNEAVLGMSIYGDDRPEVRAAVERALSTHQIALNDPYELRQGGMGLVARSGVWQGTTLWGMVTTVLDMPVILAEAGVSPDDGSVRFALRDHSGTVFHGDKSVFDSSPVIERVTLIDGSWELAAVPVLGWEGAVRDDVRAFALAGSLITVLVLLSTYLALSRNSRLAQLVALRTGELALDRHQRELLIQTVPDGITLVNAAGAITFANAAAERILELQTSALEGRRYDDPAWSICALDGGPFPPDQLPFARVRSSRKPVSDVQHAIVLPDGRRKLLSINAAPMFAADGTFSGMVASLQDITERRQAEEETLRERAFFDQLVEAAPEGIAIADGQGRILRANAEFVRMFGYRADEVAGQCIDELVAPPARQEEAKVLTRSTGQGERSSLETVRRRKDGTLVDVSLIAAPILIAGKQKAVFAIYRDITKRKQAEESLKASEERLRAVVTNVPLVLFAIGADGMFTLSEGHGLSRLGLQPGEVVGKSVFDVYQDVPEVLDNVRGALDGETLHDNVRVGDLWFESWYTPVRGLDGLVTGIIGVSADVTERVLAEETRERMQAQLLQSQKMEAIGELAGGIAHDFNNMLTGILGNVGIVQESVSLDDPLQKNIAAIQTAAQEAAHLTRGLLTFSRGAMVQPAPLDTNAAVVRTLAVLKQSLPASVIIVTKLQPDVWNVFMDQTQVTQILLNLGVNARDAMGSRGTLTVGTRNTVVDAAYVRAHQFARQGEFVVLSVADTGPGIPAEVLPHIFEPFFTTKSVGSGTGLGLSIVYGTANQSDGWITVQSELGMGALFEVFLPRSVEQPLVAVVAVAETRPCAGTVLVVEDEPVVSAVARALLTRSGYTVLTAAEGNGAIDLVRSRAPGIDLVLLDMTMPGPSTDEIISAIRNLKPDIPILLNSGYTSSDTVQRMLDQGIVQGFLSKPYELRELLERVGQLMHQDPSSPDGR